MSPSSTMEVDPDKGVLHLLFRRELVTREGVDAVVAEFLRRARTHGGRRRRPVILWRGDFETGGEESWAYWSLAVDDGQVAWFRDLQRSAESVGADSSTGSSIPGGSHGCSATPYLRVGRRLLQVFEQGRRTDSKVVLRLAGREFPARAVRYRYPAPAVESGRAEAAGPEDLVARHEGALALCRTLEGSPAAAWPVASESLRSLSLEIDTYSRSYDWMKEVCERGLGIPVIDVRMEDHGRIFVEPVWRVRGNVREWCDFRMTIAISDALSGPERRLALFHEVGHYVWHLQHLLAIPRLHWEIARAPRLEGRVMRRFPKEWWDRRNVTMEREADEFSALFVVPDGVMKWKRGACPDIHEMCTALASLRRVFNPGWKFPRRWTEEVPATWERIAAAGYRVDGTLFERLAYCVALRHSGVAANHVLEAVRLEDEMERFSALVAGSADDEPDVEVAAGRLIDRIEPACIDEVYGNPDRWDPMIVEPRDGRDATGYLPLRPMFTRGSQVDTFDWTTADGSTDGQAGTIDEWWPRAEAKGQGLLLFPMTPIEHALRSRYG